MSAITVENLTIYYHDTPALIDVNFLIPNGSFVGVMGPNGAGKSTLFKGLLGLTPCLSGRVLFFGNKFDKVKKQVAYVPQKREIDWNFPITVLEMVLMGRYHFLKKLKWYKREDYQKAYIVLHRLGIHHLADRQIDALSGGQKQRVFLARALLQESDCILLDEPFTGIDQNTEKVIMAILTDLNKQGKTILVVHHDLKTAGQYFHEILLLNTVMVGYGSAEKMLSEESIAKAYGTSNLFKELTEKLSKREQGTI